jgi:hypothetical protein
MKSYVRACLLKTYIVATHIIIYVYDIYVYEYMAILACAKRKTKEKGGRQFSNIIEAIRSRHSHRKQRRFLELW